MIEIIIAITLKVFSILLRNRVSRTYVGLLELLSGVFLSAFIMRLLI